MAPRYSRKRFSMWRLSAILDLLWRHHIASVNCILRSQLCVKFSNFNFDDFWWKINKNVKIKYSNPQKAHLWRQTRLLSTEWWRFIRRRDLQASRRKQKKRKEGRKEERKKERKKDTQNSGKLAICPDYPRRRIKIKLCTVVGVWLYTVFHKKTTRYLIAHNFGKCWPIFKIISLSDSAVNV